MAGKQKRSRFRVGDRVRVDFGRKYSGVIVEDIGPGVGGRRLFQVDIPQDPLDPTGVVFAEDEMESILDGTDEKQPLDQQKVIEYLSHGGLMSILWANRMGGKNQLRVWLCVNQLGDVTHTYYPERGVVGGQVPPSAGVYVGKVAKAKRKEVLEFLQTLGLNLQEAERVVSEAGTGS